LLSFLFVPHDPSIYTSQVFALFLRSGKFLRPCLPGVCFVVPYIYYCCVSLFSSCAMCRHRGASHSTRHGLLFAETRSSCICSRGRRRRCLFYSVESPCSLFRFPLCISIHHQTTCNTWLYIHGFRCCLTYIYKNLCGSHECPRWSLLHEGRKYQGRNSMENDAGKRNGQPTRTAASFFLPLYILLLQR